MLGLSYLIKRLIERPSKVVTDSGWDSRRVRTSHSLVASLGGLKVTLVFKRRQLDSEPKAKWLKGLSSIMFVYSRGLML
jgi:hypothetical protein